MARYRPLSCILSLHSASGLSSLIWQGCRAATCGLYSGLRIMMGVDVGASLAVSEGHARAGSAARQAGCTDRPLVLVVDDDPLNRTVMSSILRKLGYRF